MLMMLLNAHKQLRGVLFDLPHVTGDAIHVADLADRCQVMGGDFLMSVPKGGDAYIMKHILHDWDDERATQILRNCHRAMPSDGLLLVVDPVIPRGNSPHFGKLLDLEMLVLTPRGRERTRVEFEELLKTQPLSIFNMVQRIDRSAAEDIIAKHRKGSMTSGVDTTANQLGGAFDNG